VKIPGIFLQGFYSLSTDMKQLLIFFIIFVTCQPLITAQNLVSNGDFEQYTTCVLFGSAIDTNVNQPYTLPSWFSATVSGSPDYFNSCFINTSFNGYNVPNTEFGYQPARSGVGYVGIAPLSTSTSFLGDIFYSREYIQTKLSTPLVAGRSYCIGLYASPGIVDTNKSFAHTITVKNWGIHLSTERLLNPLDVFQTPGPNSFILLADPQIKADYFITDTAGWSFVGGIYTAQGGETWLTIGNFMPFGQTEKDTLILNSNGELSYYFIDDVFVVPQTDAVLLGADTAYCTQDFPVQLSANPGFNNYLWSNGANDLSIEVAGPGEYSVSADYEGCPVRDTIAIASAAQDYTPLPDLTGCINSPFQVELAAQYEFENIRWFDNSTSERVQISESGEYWFVANGLCALVTDTFTVLYDTIPLVLLGEDLSICENGVNRPVELSNTVPLSNYQWSNSMTTATITVDQSGEYTLSTTNRCGTFSDQVKVLGCAPEVYIPNAFSPAASDAANRLFSPQYVNARLLSLQVYDRWGNLVYEQRGDGGGWDGTVRGRLGESGVYVYYARFDDLVTGALLLRSGDVLLVR
jgi:gliding motility-associated-like protein